jgi:NADP-dependent 3-hydroxy acid dehydrogenase YdfG
MQKKGLFINISSVAGLVNLPLGSFYHATKKAVELNLDSDKLKNVFYFSGSWESII